MVPLSKSGVRKHRGFESRPLRHVPRSDGPWGRQRLRSSLTHLGVRSLRCSDASFPGTAISRNVVPTGRGRLVDYGAALEMRFGETRRGFESRPLRHLRAPRGRPCVRCRVRSSFTHLGVRTLRSSAPAPPRRPRGALGSEAVSFVGRARRGASGALYLQSAPAGLNPLPRSPFSNAARRRDVEDRVPRSGEPRTVSGPEGSSTKRSSSSAAVRPGPSRSSWWARGRPGRRRMHGIRLLPARLDRRRS